MCHTAREQARPYHLSRYRAKEPVRLYEEALPNEWPELIATDDMNLEGGTARLRIHNAAIIWECKNSQPSSRNWGRFSLTFQGGLTAPTCSSNTSMAESVATLKVSVMPEAIYKSSYGILSKSDRELVGAGDVPLVTLACAVMNITLAETVISERVYVVIMASKVLLGVPAICSLVLIYEIPTTYRVKAVNRMPDN